MKITVLVPSEEFRSYAGARIRYGRLAHELERLGLRLHLEPTTAFDPASTDCDILLISKCYDSRSLISAAGASARGKLVGIDLFDDYFSQRSDSRLCGHRNWLTQVTRTCDFALCSTDRMASVVRSYQSDLPSHVLNDPAATGHDQYALRKVLAEKLSRARAADVLHVAWFGVGDNPYFPVGLTDLLAYSPALAELGRSGMTVELTILTNSRALTVDGLSHVSRIPVRTYLTQWNESAERDVLNAALLAFLPVNFQPFSAAKSLNRAITALSSGCQVLSVGYPLYDSLDPLIYRDALEFIDDLARGHLRHSASTIETYECKIADLASAETEATRLAAFLHRIRPRPLGSTPTLGVIHGYSTPADAHRLTRSIGGLSIASPYCTAPLDFDVVFRGDLPDLEMLVSPEASSRLQTAAQSRKSGRHRFGGRPYLRLSDPANRSGRSRRPDSVAAPIAVQLATYPDVMEQIRRQMVDSFGPLTTIFSENSQLPFRLAQSAA